MVSKSRPIKKIICLSVSVCVHRVTVMVPILKKMVPRSFGNNYILFLKSVASSICLIVTRLPFCLFYHISIDIIFKLCYMVLQIPLMQPPNPDELDLKSSALVTNIW